MSCYLRFITICLFTGYVVCQECAIKNTSKEKTLQKDLLCSYDKEMRPRKSSDDAVNVTLRMIVKSYAYSHEYSSIGVLTVGVWFSVAWRDEWLQWNPNDYAGIQQTVIHSTKIWIPDLSLFNSVTGPDSRFNIPCLVKKNGVVSCIPHMNYRALCTSTYKKWPKDQQNCTLTFGTWMHEGKEVMFQTEKNRMPMDVRFSEPNKYWKVVTSGVDEHTGKYACCPNNTYPTVSFWIILERHSASAVAFFVTPAIVMLIMTVASVWLDINSVERMALMMLNLYCHILYLRVISITIPSSGEDLPNAAVYFRDSMILSCMVLMEGLLLRSISKRDGVAPRWVSVVNSLVNSGPGKIIMFHEFDPASSSIVAEDSENISKEEMVASSKKEWARFAVVVNRVFFILLCFTYLVLVLMYLLN